MAVCVRVTRVRSLCIHMCAHCLIFDIKPLAGGISISINQSILSKVVKCTWYSDFVTSYGDLCGCVRGCGSSVPGTFSVMPLHFRILSLFFFKNLAELPDLWW